MTAHPTYPAWQEMTRNQQRAAARAEYVDFYGVAPDSCNRWTRPVERPSTVDAGVHGPAHKATVRRVA